MTRSRNITRTALVCAVTLLALPAAGADDALAKTFAKMDEVANRFKSLSANVAHKTHMDAIHEDDSDSGTMIVKRSNSKQLRMKITIDQPTPKIGLVDGNQALLYYPSSGEIQKEPIGSRRSMFNMIVLLGFGGTSKELTKAYDVTMGGSETVAGESATRLELVPKSDELVKQVKKIDLWIYDKSGLMAQEKLYQAGKDYILVTYTNVQLNPEIPDSAFDLKAPKGVKVDNLKKK